MQSFVQLCDIIQTAFRNNLIETDVLSKTTTSTPRATVNRTLT